jgi:hypothetical protein
MSNAMANDYGFSPSIERPSSVALFPVNDTLIPPLPQVRMPDTNFMGGVISALTILDPRPQERQRPEEYPSLETYVFKDITLEIGNLGSFPLTPEAGESAREDVINFPLNRYLALGYTDPLRMGELESINNYDPNAVYAVVKDQKGEILYCIKFVTSDSDSRLIDDNDLFPTQELFDVEFLPEHHNIPKRKVCEPSRLTSVDAREYIKRHADDPKAGERLAAASYALGLGIAAITDRLKVDYWILNYMPTQAENYLRKTAGMVFEPVLDARVRPDQIGPFHPYFTKNGDQIRVTLTDANNIKVAMYDRSMREIQKYTSE